MSYWWETEEGRKRLAVEKIMMNQSYPGCGKLSLDNDALFWTMNFKIKFDGFIHECVVEIVYPKTSYPAVAPKAFVISPYIDKSLHRYPDKNLCLFFPRFKKNGWDPSKSTAVTIAAWSIDWLIAYFIWKKTGKWPGRQHE